MTSKHKWIFSLILAFTMQFSFAQEKTITGTVTENGMPLPGVGVVIKGTTNGTETDFNGKYSLNAKLNQEIEFSFIGMKTQIFKVGTSNSINVSMIADEDKSKLNEVVVTALGIKRDKKALGYSAQVVKGDNLNQAGQTNALSSLSGNVAGLQVTSPSSMGGSTRITIRGVGSVTQNNRPLIVIDGIPMDNSNYNSTDTQRGSGGRDYGDASADINPDDIESVTVLKGGPAAALYGSRAANGVIMYTTKSAKNGKSEVTFNSGLVFESINIMPKLQNLYGAGSSSTLPTATIGGNVYNIMEYELDESWGPKYDSSIKYLPWNAFDPEFPNDYLVEKPWVAPTNDVRSFFDTGITTNNSLSFTHSNDKSNIRMSFSNQSTQGIVPNSKLVKNSFTINGGVQLSKKFRADAMITFADTRGFNRPEQGYGDNSLAQKFFQWGQRQLDYEDLKNYKLSNGVQRTWNRTAWNDATPNYSDNPYWTINENTSDDTRNRYFGNVKLQYNFTDNLYLTTNLYGDQYDFTVKERVAVYSQAQSSYQKTVRTFSEFNYEARLHFNKKWENFSLSSFIGLNRRHTSFDFTRGRTSGGLIIPGLYNLSNSVNLPIADDSSSKTRVNSVFGMLSLGYKDFAFVEITDRNDYFSTVKKDANYPSITGSLIFSQLLKNLTWLSYGKLRGGWAKVSNGANPYVLDNYFTINNPFQGNPTYSNTSGANNPNLVPELKTSKELGLEMKFINNRIGFDLAVYEDTTEDLITPLEVSPSTGYATKYINAGKLQNRGIETTLYITPIKNENFSWDITWNFSKNENKLLSLYQDAKSLSLVNAPFSVSLLAVVGEKYGQIYGTDFVYDGNGNKVVDGDGYYLVSERKSLGSIIPDYNMGIRNSFTYKNINFGFLFDIQKGGKYFSTTHMWGHYAGQLEETAANGIRENGIVVDAVYEDGTKNTSVISGYDWATGHYGTVDAQNVFDASYFKLREVTLSYAFPKKYIGSKLSSVKISAFGRNLLTWGLAWNSLDPENTSYGSGNIQGLEGGSLPSTRTYGMSLEIKL